MPKVVIRRVNSISSGENPYLLLYVLLVVVLIVSVTTIVFVVKDIKTKMDEERIQQQNDKIEQILQDIDDEGLNYPSKI